MSSQPLKALIVEDDGACAEMLSGYLTDRRGQAFSVQRAADVRAAVERLSGASFDLVILDLHLPDGRGLEVFDRVRSLAPQAAVLIVSGDDNGEDFALQAVERGAQDYLTKGDFDWKAFTRSVDYAVARKKMEEDLRQNVAELRTVEEKLRATNSALERKVQELDRLIRIMTGREERIIQLKEENRTLRALPAGGRAQGSATKD